MKTKLFILYLQGNNRFCSYIRKEDINAICEQGVQIFECETW